MSRSLAMKKLLTPPDHLLQTVYAGIEIELSSKPSWCVYFYDGFSRTDYYVRDVSDKLYSLASDESYAHGMSKILEQIEDEIVQWILEWSEKHRYKVHAAGVGIVDRDLLFGVQNQTVVSLEKGSLAHNTRQTGKPLYGFPKPIILLSQLDASPPEVLTSRLPAKLWSDLDILPVLCCTYGPGIEERACSAARKCISFFGPLAGVNVPRLCIGSHNEVEVDANGWIHMVDLSDFRRQFSSDGSWQFLLKMAERTRNRNLRIGFVSSTAQGGGVALMRHALIRLLKLLGIDAHWFVTRPSPTVFDITKRKIHNVLQGVTNDVWLTKEDEVILEEWWKDNAERYWTGGPFMNLDVLVVDDPQLRTDLIETEGTPQHHVWQFLWKQIKEADCFISHPVADFVPSGVDCVFGLPASTCGFLDGLNKELRDLGYYQHFFNRVCHEQIGRQADFSNRPYIIQICRFDPSKGIPDLIEIYALFRARIQQDHPTWSTSKIPQLVISGHGSVDDPDSGVIFEQVLELLESSRFSSIRDDILVARVPSSDQLLNALLSGSMFACQMSTREGFEIKVTEALSKGIPVIAYASGGIPIQIWDGVTGFLVETGNKEAAADRFYLLVTDSASREKISDACRRCTFDDYFTATNAICWLVLCNAVSDGTLASRSRQVKAVISTQLDNPLTEDQHSTDVMVQRVCAIDWEAWRIKARREYSGGMTWVKDLWSLYSS
ncbi:hypothetical protein SmJEL517_g06276 [Synchytrium microbalum]|uniref:Uncharacterized protein n=1 Tax=Synchytrium microbalum TaxID=1806994 RepID=A0A507BRK4_9FUNG|nr:uncharacterized protein SmJEL517_g06276 [Synchytrium microbalum]TPX30061.1 hypothetical protein SmJEL517_g06276 [Synchytrium microbalum]